MRLADLILGRMDEILSDFEDFARTHTTAGAAMDVAALRDHAESMLRAFVVDMEGPQSDAEQKRKSFGDAPRRTDTELSAASRHGHDRAGSGFTLEEMFAEYRALRASVLRHWTASQDEEAHPGIVDMIRFNEAIDQAVAESITRYATTVSEYREMFLAVLGHDLRTPLSAVLTASEFLAEDDDLSARNLQLVSAIRSSGGRMNELVNDLLDFTLSRLGRGIPIQRTRTDVGTLVRAMVDEVRVMNPGREFRFDASGDLEGEWDRRRIAQAISNLVSNAVRHGASDSAITIVARGEDDKVVIAVRNRGNVIPPEDMIHIFEPFRRRASDPASKDGRSMGLGLHIVQQIATAHHGTVEVESSSERGTTFTLRLPRHAAG